MNQLTFVYKLNESCEHGYESKYLIVIDRKVMTEQRLQALSLTNDCYKYIMDLTTNGVVITDAIKFVQTNKENLTTMSTNEENNGKESKEPD
jgi:hypothetical protein